MTATRSTTMKQLDLGLNLNLSTKKTRKGKFLDEMERVVPWAALVQIVSSSRTARGRRRVVHLLVLRRCCGFTICSSGFACRTRR